MHVSVCVCVSAGGGSCAHMPDGYLEIGGIKSMLTYLKTSMKAANGILLCECMRVCECMHACVFSAMSAG